MNGPSQDLGVYSTTVALLEYFRVAFVSHLFCTNLNVHSDPVIITKEYNRIIVAWYASKPGLNIV